jgi:hypothetical protein
MILLSIEEMTYVYETLHERISSGTNSNKEDRLCKKVMLLIEENILKEKEEEND